MTAARRARRAPAAAGGTPLPLRRERMLSALEAITPDERLVLALLVYEGLTLEETAGLLGRSPRTVEAICDRLMIELRRAIAGRPVSPRVPPEALRDERIERAADRRAA